MMNIASRVIPGALAFLVCAGLLPPVNRLARLCGLYDGSGPLKIHRGPIARLGGIGMFSGLVAGSFLFLAADFKHLLLPFAVFLAVFLVGLADDLKSLPAIARLGVQLGAGAAFWLGGWHLGTFGPPALNLVATSLFVALILNAMNFLDGMDGLAAGTTAVISLGFFALAWSDSNGWQFSLAICLLGACAGMLTRNFPPATMFMGDSGSTLIGIVLAFLSLSWIHSQADNRAIFVPLIFLAVPLADLALAILRRARNHAALFAGDRRHFYDLLLQRGWTVYRVLGISLAATGVFVLDGLLYARGSMPAWFAVVLVIGFACAAAFLLGSLHSENFRVQPGPQEAVFGSSLGPLEGEPPALK